VKFSVLEAMSRQLIPTARKFEGFIAPDAPCQRNCASAIAPICSSSKYGKN